MKRIRNVRMKTVLLAMTVLGFIFYLTRMASYNVPTQADANDHERRSGAQVGPGEVPVPATEDELEDSYDSLEVEESDPELFKVSENELSLDMKQLMSESRATRDYRGQVEQEDVDNNLKTISADPERAALLRQANSSDRPSGIEPKEYLIVEYTKVFYQPKFCSKSNEDIFNSKIESCPINNCKYTCNKDRDVVSKASMLVFHLRDLESEFANDKFKSNYEEWLKGTEQLPFKTTEDKLANNKNQLWLLWNDESTPINRNLNKMSNFFNWTMSFKTNSEVYEGSYGFLKMKNGLDADKVAKQKQEIFAKDFKSRRNAILWFVSNCNSKYRIKIALEISKYYPVYVFGKCNIVKDMSPDDVKKTYPYLNSMGSAQRPHSSKDDDESFLRNDVDCSPGSECEEKRFKAFKYYLAFENRNCTDYITEKIWRSLSKSIVPIVLQPAKQSYLKYQIPTGSFIHLQDFDQDIKKLANYLKQMNKDFKRYYDHLKWTSVYTEAIWQADYLEPHRMCQLCKLLNSYDKSIYYNNIVDFFNNQCSDPL